MADELHNLKPKSHQRGNFGEYWMYGLQYEDEAGKLAWWVNVWRDKRGPNHGYWVEDGEFSRSSIHVAYNYSNRTLIQTLGAATDIDPKEKAAILQAISEWESETKKENTAE